MREIKFRVWDGTQMFYGDVIEFIDGVVCFHSGLNSTLEGCSISEFKGEVMQYTGLKDKNGKEIYEGDIIKHRFSGGEIVNLLIKYPLNLFAGFCMYEKNDKKYEGTNKEYKFVDVLNTNYAKAEEYKNEIIGNIYENPELLKD